MKRIPPSFLLKEHKPLLYLFLVFLLAEVFVNPTGNFPLNDDGVYTVALKEWEDTGRLNIGAWPAMTLLTHLAWGRVFTGLFGFSFFVLRLSTSYSARKFDFMLSSFSRYGFSLPECFTNRPGKSLPVFS
jgi:hypothetical protein